MKPVKTYEQVDAKKESASFSISKMQATFLKRKGKVDEPHRHNFYSVLVVKNATGQHKVDFNSYPLSNHQVHFVAPGQVHQVIEEVQSDGYVLTFSTQFLIENAIAISFVEHLNLFQNYGETPPLEPNEEQFDIILNFVHTIFDLFESNRNMKELSIGAYLKLFLIECNRICAINPVVSDADISGESIIRSFKNSVNQQYKKEHSASFYAQLLHITPDHLNRIIKAKIGKTAKEYIQSKITIEAKRLLYFSELSNKEIGYELGFNEPANFSAFFKKQTKLSPSYFKKRESTT